MVITGSNGLIGQKLVSLLADRPAVELVAWGRGANRHPKRVGYTYESLDLLDADHVRARLQEIKPTAIVHCAAMSQADACENDPAACQAANVTALEHLLVATRGLNTHIVFLSTDFVFDGEQGPYREDAPTAPLSEYGRTKLAAEQLLLRQEQPVTILRTALVYGAAPHLSRSNLVMWVVNSLQEATPIRVVEDQVRSPTLAEDVADACAAAIFRQKTGIYHVAGPEILTVLEVARRTADAFDLDPKLISPVKTAELSEAARRPLRTGLVILKAQTELGFTPHTLDAGLARVRTQLQREA